MAFFIKGNQVSHYYVKSIYIGVKVVFTKFLFKFSVKLSVVMVILKSLMFEHVIFAAQIYLEKLCSILSKVYFWMRALFSFLYLFDQIFVIFVSSLQYLSTWFPYFHQYFWKIKYNESLKVKQNYLKFFTCFPKPIGFEDSSKSVLFWPTNSFLEFLFPISC